jgi:Uma2 family endonuclease
MGDGYVTTRPGLVVEVVSEQDEQEGIGMRVGAWLDFGVDEVWVVDPKRRTVTVHGAVRDARVYRHGEEVAGDGVLAGFSMQVAALFGV